MIQDVTPLVSVVIPTYQRRESLKRALDGLGRQTLAPDRYEVIVSVDGSTDGTCEMLAALPTRFPLRVAPDFPNHGRASACNRGLRNARGELIVILDDDMEPVSAFLEEHLRRHGDIDRRAVLGAVPVRCDESSTPVARYVAAKFNVHLEKLKDGTRIEGRAFYTGNFSIRRSVLLEAGAFDESFKVYGNEDVDLGLRLGSRGIEIVYSADALAYQHYEKTLAALAHDQMAKGHTAVLLAGKHPAAASKTKLASYQDASPRWRMVRAAMLACTRRAPRVVKAVIRALDALDRRKSRALERWLPHLADYFFWLGVSSAFEGKRRLSLGARLAALSGNARS